MIMHFQHSYSGLKKNRVCTTRKGLTLVELLAAISIVPVVLLSASVLSLNTYRSSQEIFAQGQILADMSNIFETMKKSMVNGTSATAPTQSDCNENDDGEFCYALAIAVPGHPNQIYRFRSAQPKNILEVSYDNGNTFSQLAYASIMQPPRNTDNYFTTPFSISSDNRQITIKLNFIVPDGRELSEKQMEQTVTLMGGNGI